jgi:hypothetical protein
MIIDKERHLIEAMGFRYVGDALDAEIAWERGEPLYYFDPDADPEEFNQFQSGLMQRAWNIDKFNVYKDELYIIDN